MAKISELEILSLLLMLPDDAALTTAEAAVVLRTSPRTMERWRSTGEGPPYIQSGAPGAAGSNQRITYLKGDLRAWQERNKVASNIEAAVRKGLLFSTLADLAEERPFWRTPNGRIGGPVEDTSVEIFLARLGKWEIEWLAADDAASETWESLLSQRAFAVAVTDVLRNQMGKIESGMDRSELEHAVAEAGGGLPAAPSRPLTDF
jgi:hypothetical protein